ncbi:transposase [Endozoicomonas sp. SCSIO W0465]|uniref:IS66 family transposase n=1 Tax=Endozoicomonas sp. SCSIO W0465 TaxID=2918516 RepID=UPI002075AA26|nr:transposase [Endozoicomonas sp. SCSIO W0465]
MSEYFNTLYKMSVSAGTVANFVARTYENLASTEEVIRDALRESSVAGADETGMRAEGSLHWLHVMRDEQWTLYYCLKSEVVRPWTRWHTANICRRSGS